MKCSYLSLLPLLGPVGFATALPAQLQIQLDCQSGFYRTYSDSARPALAVPLGQIGVMPGQWLRIQEVGAFALGSGYADDWRSLAAVFSSDATLLPSDQQVRVPGAIAAGPSFEAPTTYFGNLPMDFPEDFYVSRPGFGDSVLVRVPAGANYLFVAPLDVLYGDNYDPNGDYGVVFTAVPQPGLPGSGEHLVLASGVDAPPAVLPEVALAHAGANVPIELREPQALLSGGTWFLAAELVGAGQVPVPVFPDVALDGNAVVLAAGVDAADGQPLGAVQLTVPAAALGLDLLVQGVILPPSQARNGLYEASNGHRVLLR